LVLWWVSGWEVAVPEADKCGKKDKLRLYPGYKQVEKAGEVGTQQARSERVSRRQPLFDRYE
jgi:hypothetical protein